MKIFVIKNSNVWTWGGGIFYKLDEKHCYRHKRHESLVCLLLPHLCSLCERQYYKYIYIQMRPTDRCKGKQRYAQWHSISNSNKFKPGNKCWVGIFISQSQSFKSQQHQSQSKSGNKGMRMTIIAFDMTLTFSLLLNHLMFAVLNSHSDYLITLICGYIALKLWQTIESFMTLVHHRAIKIIWFLKYRFPLQNFNH